jgi:TonB-linked SusC/RagA family outer membrane protein
MLCILSCAFSAYSQKKVSGTVVDVKGETIIGASVVEKGTTNGVITDLGGKFSLNVPVNTVLQISYVGYVTQEIPVGNQTILNITLVENSLALDEVVVVGYGTVKKGNLTSAVSHVSSKDFLGTNATNPVEQIQGKVAGVTISNTGAADPNSGASIQVRGISSRAAGLGPLVVIDGVPGGDLYNINNNDIESIDILKDGAASAIYGTRGSNGVIIVTTKNGGSSDGTFKASYNGSVSADIPTGRLEALSADEFRQHRVPTGRGKDFGANTDWLDEVSQTGFTQNHALTLMGGTANNNYRLTVDAKDAKGVDLRSKRDEYGARLSLNHKAKNGLYEVYINIAPRIVNSDNSDWGVFNQALLLNPTMPVKDPDDISGNKYFKPVGYDAYNPVEALKLEKSGTEEKKLSWSGTFKLNLLPVIAKTPNHTLNTNVTIAQQINDNFNYWFRPAASTRSLDSGYQGEASRGYGKNLQQSLEWLADYKFQSNGHTAAFVGGYSYQYFQYQGLSAENKNFTSDALTYNNLANGSYQQVEGRLGFGSSKNDSKLIAFLGRFTYDYQSKYLLTASLRYEGSSKFGINNKWGYFPAASAGWRISQERFLESADWLSDLKLRADLGVTGNQDFDNYRSLSTYGGFGDVLYNGIWYKGWAPNKNDNPNLKWEKGINWNVGLDFSILDYRLAGSVNYYHRTQQDLLGDYNVPSPPYLFNSIFTNVGTMKNTGIEAELNIRAVDNRDFSYSIGLVGASNNNEFVHFSNNEYSGQDYYWVVGMPGPGTPGSVQQLREGQRIGTFVTWKYAGIDDKGNWLVYDQEDNVIPINDAVEADKRVTGNGLPKYTLSLNNTFRYKNWDASVYLRGAFGFDLFNVHTFYYGLPTSGDNYNTLKVAYTDNAAMTSAYNVLTDYFLEKGDYVKLDVVSIGYNFKFTSPWVESLRLYTTIKNLATFTGFSGVDPEAIRVNGLYPGIDQSKNYYPSTTQVLFGLQLNF